MNKIKQTFISDSMQSGLQFTSNDNIAPNFSNKETNSTDSTDNDFNKDTLNANQEIYHEPNQFNVPNSTNRAHPNNTSPLEEEIPTSPIGNMETENQTQMNEEINHKLTDNDLNQLSTLFNEETEGSMRK